MQSTTTQSYQATPSTAQQLTGLGITGLGAYKAMSGFAEGGEVRGMAVGGGGREMAGGVQGALRAKLETMSDQQLQQVAGSSPSAELRAMAQEVLAEHKIREQAEEKARQAIAQEQAPKPQIPQAAPAGLAAAPAPNMDTVGAATGGIVAFAGDDEETGSLVQAEPTLEERLAGIKDPRMKAAAERYTGLSKLYGADKDPYTEYRKFLAGEKEGLGKQRDYVIGSGLMDLGSRLASTPGPWGSAIAQSIQGALPQFQKGVADYRTQRAGLYKGEADISAKDVERAQKALEGTEKAYESEEDRANRLKQAQISAGPGYASANRPTDLMNAYSIELGKLTGGDLSKATPEQKQQAMRAAGNLLRGTDTRLGIQQTAAETTALKDDTPLQNLYKQKKLLSMTPKQAEKNKTAIEDLDDQIAAREDYVKRRANRQPQQTAGTGAGADASGAPVVDFGALPKRGTS